MSEEVVGPNLLARVEAALKLLCGPAAGRRGACEKARSSVERIERGRAVLSIAATRMSRYMGFIMTSCNSGCRDLFGTSTLRLCR